MANTPFCLPAGVASITLTYCQPRAAEAATL